MPLTTDDVKFILKRSDRMKSVRAMYEPLWEEIAEYEFPRRVGIGSTPSPGAKQTLNLYDSTAIHANELLAASMHGTLTPSSSRWFSLKLRDDRLNQRKDVMDWLEVCADRMYLALRQSNFNSEIHEVYLDQGAFGTACILLEEKPITGFGFNGLQFKSLYNSEYCIAEDAEGKVDTLAREFDLSARAAAKKWGKERLSEKIQGTLERDPEENFRFLHFVMPSEERGAGPFVSYYIELESKSLVAERRYYEFPYMVPRWSKSSGEIYGRGPGHTALPDTKSLNKAKEFGLQAWALDLYPPTFEKNGGVIGSLKRIPGGRNMVKDKDSIWVMDHKSKYDVSQVKEEELRKSIRQIYYSDQLKLQEGPEMTATEVQVRYELMQRLLGPTIGRDESELLNPLIERKFGIMMRASSRNYPVLPPPPPILAVMGVRDLDIEYEGPLAKAQRMSEVSGMRQLFQVGLDISQAQPDVFDNLDGDLAFRNAAEVMGAPSRILRSEEERDARREERGRAQAEEKQKSDLERAAQGLGAAAPALKLMQPAPAGGLPGATA